MILLLALGYLSYLLMIGLASSLWSWLFVIVFLASFVAAVALHEHTKDRVEELEELLLELTEGRGD